MQKSIYFFNKMPTLWSLEVNKTILEQVPVDTLRRFNVYATSMRRRWRRIDVV